MTETPPWLVDVEDLRDLLDRLRGALRRPPSMRGPLDPLTLAYDGAALKQSMLEVATLAEKVDLRLLEALATASTQLPDAEHAKRLAALVHELSGLWRVRVTMGLRPRRIPVLRALLREPGPDLLGIFRKEDDENAHSDILRWLLDPREAPTVAPVALRGVMSRLPHPERWHRALDDALKIGCLCVRREVILGHETFDEENWDRLDLIVSGPSFVLGIENKVWCAEHEGQTPSYARWLESFGTSMLTGGLFLSPSGAPASSSSFVPLSYLELSAYLLEAGVHGELQHAERHVLSGYLKTLGRRILRAEFQAALEMEGNS